MQTTIKYGASNDLTRDFGNTTVGDLTSDAKILGALDAPEGVNAVSSGRTLGDNELVSSYTNITLEKRASQKA